MSQGPGGGGMWQPSRDIHSPTSTFLSEGNFGSESDQPCCPAASGIANTVPTACVDSGNPHQLCLDLWLLALWSPLLGDSSSPHLPMDPWENPFPHPSASAFGRPAL